MLKKDSTGKIILGGAKLSSGLKAADPLALGKTLTTDQMKERFKGLAEEFKKRDARWGRFIIVGTGKSGKTAALRTLPSPILLAVFDPDSESVLTEEIEAGKILPIRYYGDDPEAPSSYTRWEADVLTWKRDGFFGAFASYAIDSFSSWMISAMRQIAFADQQLRIRESAKNPRQKLRESLMPQLQDYNVLKVGSITTFLALCSLPCHLVLNAHILEERVYRDTEDQIGYIRRVLNATPALQANIPPLFMEVYLAETKLDEQKKRQWIWKTTPQGKYPDIPIGSRISGLRHLLTEEEPQDFRALLKKCKFHFEDKPALA